MICLKKFVLFGIALGCVALGWSATKIEPYTAEASVHAMIGQTVTVSGTYYKDVFNAPVVMIKGHSFYLLQDPPSKGTYKFPSKSRSATVTGTLYHFDSARGHDAEYAAIEPRFFYFKVDESDLSFDEAEAAEGQRVFMKTWKYNLEYTQKAIGIRGEDFKRWERDEFDEADGDKIVQHLTYSMFENGRLKIAADSVTMTIPRFPTAPADLEVKSISGNLLKGAVTEPLVGTYEVELEIMSNGMLRYSFDVPGVEDLRMHLYFDP